MVAGVDVGGSTTKACIVDGTTNLVSTVLPTTFTGPSDLGELAVQAVRTAAGGAGYAIDDLAGVGIGIPGQVSGGLVRNAANLGIDEDGYDLGAHVTTATGLPTIVENDMTVAAYGAFRQLSADEPGLENLVYIGLGTGVAAGVVLDGRVFRGGRGLAGEFGHVPMGTGIACACGSVGCLETVIGSHGLRESWRGELTTELFDSANEGDESAQSVVDRAIDHLALAMWWLAATYDPDYFLIGGGVGVNNPAIRDLIAARWADMSAKSALARRVLDPDRIRMSDLDEPVGAYGAALLADGHPGHPGETNPDENWEEEKRK